MKETGTLPRDFVPRWVFIAIAVREAISHGFGDLEFVEEAVNELRIASKSLLWSGAIQEIDECLGWFHTEEKSNEPPTPPRAIL